MTLCLDRDADAAERVRAHHGPALVATLDGAAVLLHAGDDRHRLDRSTLALVPARRRFRLQLPRAGATAVATLVLSDALCAAAVRDYRPDVDASRLGQVLAALRVLPRTRWVDEVVHRYVFELSVCARHGSRAALFLEVELTKEIYFLGCEQVDGLTRGSALFEGSTVTACARSWIEEHLFEPFHMDQVVRHCHASESTLLRAFHRDLGVSPLAYLRRRRLEESLHLLESGRYGVAEVAARVGYDNPSAFAAAFRKQFGVVPSRSRPAVAAKTRLPAHGATPVRRRRRRG